ncbi:helix-turn-helix domain-containing protein [Pyruvatibacter mobilis]|uniref:helix-turn-helix domain-containing protein n=1 Tax=Pyruvatibacter mobilis TaxID=1712261 RepID=UPI003BAFE0D0
MEKSNEAIAARLRATREALGLSQSDLCKQSGIARNTYNQFESGVRRPSIDAAIKLCESITVTLDWIYRGVPDGLPHGLATKIRGVR